MNLLVEEVLEEVRGAWRFCWWKARCGKGIVPLAGPWSYCCAPDMREGRATVFVDTRTALRPVLQGLAVEQDVDAEPRLRAPVVALCPAAREDRPGCRPAEFAAQRTCVSASLPFTACATASLITVISAGSSEGVRQCRQHLWNRLSGSQICSRSSKSASAHSSHFLIVDTLGGKRQGSEDAQKFLETQIRDYETRLRAAEDKLAEFKKQNVGAMPTEQGGYFARLQAEMDAVKTAQTALSVAMSRRDISAATWRAKPRYRLPYRSGW